MIGGANPMMHLEEKPKNRSKFRNLIGRNYYTAKRYMQWYVSSNHYAKEINTEPYPYAVFSHKTILLRKLQDVDMHLQYNKITNLKIAIGKLNGIVIKPHETFSYWKLIGKPTYRKGYLDGLVLCPNGDFKSGVGGGLCQISNMIYWMTLHTPLTVTERYRHSHDIFPDVNRTQPFGTGATCSYPSLDLQIYNGTSSEFQLVLHLTKEYLMGEWRSTQPPVNRYQVYEKEHTITPGLFGGYIRNNIICRKIYGDMGLIKDEYLIENHAYMTYAPFLNECSATEEKL